MSMRAAIYCRLSEEDKHKQSMADDSESIQNQKSMLLQYAIEQGWEVYHIYSDDDYAGADRNRPAFRQLLADAENHKFEIVLCKTQSRFTRELEMVEKYIHGLFLQWNIRFVSVVDNADTDIKGNKKSRQINGLVNEWYLEDMSENIKSVLTDKRERGLHIGSFALYGYRKDIERKGHLIMDEEAANTVREIFILFSQGYGKTAIARMLNDRGIPNPTEYKRLQGLRYQQPKLKNSKLWKYFSISNILVNELYIGNMIQGKYGSISYKSKINKPRPKEKWFRVCGTHVPIIDHALWDRVQALVAQRTKPFSAGEIGIFAKKVRCMNCGYVMRSSKTKDKYYLQCSNRHVAKDACVGSFIAAAKLEEIILSELNRFIREYLNEQELEQKVEFSNTLTDEKSKLLTQMELYRKGLADCEKAVKSLYMDKIKGILSESEFVDFSKEFQEDKLRFEKAITAMQTKVATLETKMQCRGNRHTLIQEYTTVARLDRETVDKLIAYIEVGKRIEKTRKRPIQIHWNF